MTATIPVPAAPPPAPATDPAAPGTRRQGQAQCPQCSGQGTDAQGRTCPVCQGSGEVMVGDA